MIRQLPVFFSPDDVVQTEQSSKSFTNLFDFYASPTSSVISPEVVTLRHSKPPPVSSDSYQVPTAALNFLPSSFRSNCEEVTKRSLSRTRSDRRCRFHGLADVTSRLRPLLLVPASHEAGSQSASAPASASSVIKETRKASSRCLPPCAAFIWLSWLFLCFHTTRLYQLLFSLAFWTDLISMFCGEYHCNHHRFHWLRCIPVCFPVCLLPILLYLYFGSPQHRVVFMLHIVAHISTNSTYFLAYFALKPSAHFKRNLS